MTENKDCAHEQVVGTLSVGPNEARVRRQGVVVLGMHRSGTSALAGVLGKLGCALPTDLMDAGDGNEKGHWEPQGIVALNDRVLESGGSHWEDWTRFNPGWYRSPLYPSFLQNARDSLRVSFGDEPLFVLKDPRICRLARFWIEAMEAEDIDLRFVLCLRDPLQVAGSLARRDGMEKDYGALLWLRHTLEAESSTRGRSRIICSHNQLLMDWRSTTDRIGTALDISWPRKSASTAAQITEFLTASSGRQKERVSALLPDLAGQAYEIFFRWAERGEDEADYAQLDGIMIAFENAADLFAGLILPGSHSLGAGGVKSVREDLTQQIEAQQEKIQALELEAAQLKADMDGMHEAQAKASHPNESDPPFGELEEATVALNAQVAALRSTLDLQADEAMKREEEYSQSVQRLGLIESTLRQREEEIEQTRSELGRTRDLVAEREADLANAQDRAAQAHQRLEEADSWVFKLSKERQAAEALTTSLQRQLADAMVQSTRNEVQLARAQAQLTNAGSEISTLKAELESLSQEAAKACEDLLSAEEEWEALSQSDRIRITQQQAELSAITRLLLEAEQARAVLEVERNRLNTDKADLNRQIDDVRSTYQTEIESRQAHGQSEVSLMAERLREAEHARALIEAERDSAILEKAILLHQIEDVRAMVALSPEAGGEDRQAAAPKPGFAELVRESTLMTQLLATAEESAALATEHRAWLKEVNAWLVKRPSWWSLLPAEMRRQREWANLQRRGIFDAAAYLQLYPDVAAEGMNPLHHYIAHGMAEGRKLTR